MKIQIRKENGEVKNEEIDTTVDFIRTMKERGTLKMSFDFLDGSRLVLYQDGQYQIVLPNDSKLTIAHSIQIFGGLLNHPMLEK